MANKNDEYDNKNEQCNNNNIDFDNKKGYNKNEKER